MNELNTTFDKLFRQIIIGGRSQYGLKKGIAEKYLKMNGGYSLDDFIKTVNERYSGKYVMVANDDRIICLSVNPKLKDINDNKILKERSLAILCLIFIYQSKTGIFIKESDLFAKLSNYLSPQQIKSTISELKRGGYLEILSSNSKTENQLSISQVGMYVLPQSVIEEALNEIIKNSDYSLKLKEILPIDYLKIQGTIQKTLDHENKETE
jgi:hypothetical protein